MGPILLESARVWLYLYLEWRVSWRVFVGLCRCLPKSSLSPNAWIEVELSVGVNEESPAPLAAGRLSGLSFQESLARFQTYLMAVASDPIKSICVYVAKTQVTES